MQQQFFGKLILKSILWEGKVAQREFIQWTRTRPAIKFASGEEESASNRGVVVVPVFSPVADSGFGDVSDAFMINAATRHCKMSTPGRDRRLVTHARLPRKELAVSLTSSTPNAVFF